jgi:colicin import membrane protein
MVREHENSQAVKAAFLALLVHAGFFLVLLLSFNWKSEMPLQVSDVQLWDSLPMPKAQPLPPPPKPEPKPEIKPEPRPEPPPPQPEPKAEIAVKKPEPPPQPKPEKKNEKPKVEKKVSKPNQPTLKDIQNQFMDDPLAQVDQELKAIEAARQSAQVSAASQGEVDDYKGRIRNKIYSWMNRQPCGNAVPEYSISVLPTGQIAGAPKLVKSSGIPACDDAALRAIMQAQPLPLPPNPELFSNFRDLRIPFKPE